MTSAANQLQWPPLAGENKSVHWNPKLDNHVSYATLGFFLIELTQHIFNDRCQRLSKWVFSFHNGKIAWWSFISCPLSPITAWCTHSSSSFMLKKKGLSGIIVSESTTLLSNGTKWQLSGLVVRKLTCCTRGGGSNPGWGAQEFSISCFRNSAACRSHAT